MNHGDERKSILISYCSSESAIASRVERVVEGLGHQCYSSAWSLQPGSPFSRSIRQAHGEFEIAVVLVSAKLASQLTQSEWELAVRECNRTLIPVRVDETDVASIIGTRTYVDEFQLGAGAIADALSRFLGQSLKVRSGSVEYPGSGPAAELGAHVDVEPARCWRVPQSALGNSNPASGALIELIDSALLTRPLAVIGAAGSGKSGLIVQYCLDRKDSFDGVWWVDATSTRSVVAGLSDLAVERGLVPSGSDRAAAAYAARIWYESLTADRALLLVFDGATDDTVAPWLPVNKSCRAIITSRSGRWEGLCETLDIEHLDVQLGANALVRLTGWPDRLRALRLSERVRGSALALEMMSNLIVNANLTFEQFEEVFDKFQVGPSELEQIGTLFELAWQSAQSASSVSSRTLLICALTGEHGTSESLLTRLGLNGGVNSLIRYGLLKATSAGRVEIHNLIAQFSYSEILRSELRAKEMLEDLNNCIRGLLVERRLDLSDTRDFITLWRGVLRATTPSSLPSAAIVTCMCNEAAELFGWRKGSEDLLEDFSKFGSAAISSDGAAESPDLRAMAYVCLFSRILGGYGDSTFDVPDSDATNLLVSRSAKVAVEDDLDPLVRCRLMRCIAEVLMHLNEYRRAELYLRRAEEALTSKPEWSRSPSAFNVQIARVKLLTAQERHTEAIQLIRELLEVLDERLGPEQIRVAELRGALAVALIYGGETELGLAEFDDVWVVLSRLPGTNDGPLSALLGGTADALIESGQFRVAIDLLGREELNQCFVREGANQRRVQLSLRLARCHNALGESVAALQVLQHALAELNEDRNASRDLANTLDSAIRSLKVSKGDPE